MHAPQLLDRLVETAERFGGTVPEQQLRLQARAHELARDRIDALGAGPGARADGAIEAFAAKQEN